MTATDESQQPRSDAGAAADAMPKADGSRLASRKRALARYLGSAGRGRPPHTGDPVQPSAVQEPVAIIGLGCRFPGGDGPQAFWQTLRDGVDTIRKVPADRWRVDDFYAAEAAPGKTNARWGGFLERVDAFDAAAFGISPGEARRMDPQQRLALEVTWEALEHGGIPIDALAGSPVGVFLGISTWEYSRLHSSDLTLFDLRTYTGTAHSIAANRISQMLDLRGPSLAVDTACSSSMVAVHLACQSLRLQECDLALAGGVNVLLTPECAIGFSQAHMMAGDGRCKAFDARADGYVRGEGCGIVVLKRLGEAERDGDRVLAVVRGSAVNQDGHTLALTAPSAPAQQAVIGQALASAGIAPAAVDYVEAHGTGTALGDPIEVEALKATYLHDRPNSRPLLVGTVKSNVGHLEAAAGVAGLIKTVLALHHGVVPANLHLTELNPLIDVEGVALEFPITHRPWPAADGAERVAGVSSFGFGGTNAHLVVSSTPGRGTPSVEEPPAEPLESVSLLPISARSPEALRELAGRYAALLEEHQELPHHQICAAAALDRAHHSVRFAAVARSRAELVDRLRAFADGRQAGVANSASARSPQVTQLESLGALYEAGDDIDWSRQFSSPDRPVVLPTYPWQRRSYWYAPETTAESSPPADSALVEMGWQPDVSRMSRESSVGSAAPAEAWIILGKAEGPAGALSLALASAGVCPWRAVPSTAFRRLAPRLVEVDPHSTEGLDRFFRLVEAEESTKVGGVVWLSEPKHPSGEMLPGRAAESALASLARLVQSMITRPGETPKLWIVTRGAQATGGESIDLAQAPLWGLGRAIEREIPDLWGGAGGSRLPGSRRHGFRGRSTRRPDIACQRRATIRAPC